MFQGVATHGISLRLGILLCRFSLAQAGCHLRIFSGLFTFTVSVLIAPGPPYRSLFVRRKARPLRNVLERVQNSETLLITFLLIYCTIFLLHSEKLTGIDGIDVSAGGGVRVLPQASIPRSRSLRNVIKRNRHRAQVLVLPSPHR